VKLTTPVFSVMSVLRMLTISDITSLQFNVQVGCVTAGMNHHGSQGGSVQSTMGPRVYLRELI